MGRHEDGPARSSMGHHFGVNAARRARVPLSWGIVREATQAKIAAANAAMEAKQRAQDELAWLLQRFPQLARQIADLKGCNFNDSDVLNWQPFRDAVRELQHRFGSLR